MGLSERIAEIDELKSKGLISEIEYDALVKIAVNSSWDDPETEKDADSSKTIEIEKNKNSEQLARPNRNIAIAILVGIVAVVLGFNNFKSKDPLKSSEYKKLLEKQTELTNQKLDLSSKSSETLKIKAEADGLLFSVDFWNRILKDINNSGISG